MLVLTYLAPGFTGGFLICHPGAGRDPDTVSIHSRTASVITTLAVIHYSPFALCTSYVILPPMEGSLANLSERKRDELARITSNICEMAPKTEVKRRWI